MSTSSKTIAKNAGVMMVSQIITWSLSFLIIITQPRYLGPHAVGQLAIASSLWLIIGVLMGFGMDIHLFKSIALAPNRVGELVGTSIIMRCLLYVPGVLLSFLSLYLFGYPIEIFYISSIIGVTTFVSLMSSPLGAALNGLERMEYNSLVSVVNKFVSTGLILLFVFLGFNVYWIAAVDLFVSIVNLCILFYFSRKYFRIELRLPATDRWAMLRASSPFLITSFTMIAYHQIDNLIVSRLVSIDSAGWYRTAQNLAGTLMFLPYIASTVLFPILSRSYAAGQGQMAPIARRSFDLMILLGIPIGLGTMLIARPMILLLLGEGFAPSGEILELQGLVLFVIYLNTMLGQLIISTERTSRWNVVMIAVTVLTLPLDLFLMPWTERVLGNGGLGGVISYAITESVMLAATILLLPKNTFAWSNLRTVVLTMVAGLGMVAASWWFRDSYMILSVLVGAVSYFALVMLLRILSPEDMGLLKAGMGQVLAKLRGGNQAPAGLGGD